MLPYYRFRAEEKDVNAFNTSNRMSNKVPPHTTSVWKQHLFRKQEEHPQVQRKGPNAVKIFVFFLSFISVA